MIVSASVFFKDINSWDDFESKVKDFSRKEKGDAFELLTNFAKKYNKEYRIKVSELLNVSLSYEAKEEGRILQTFY